MPAGQVDALEVGRHPHTDDPTDFVLVAVLVLAAGHLGEGGIGLGELLLAAADAQAGEGTVHGHHHPGVVVVVEGLAGVVERVLDPGDRGRAGDLELRGAVGEVGHRGKRQAGVVGVLAGGAVGVRVVGMAVADDGLAVESLVGADAPASVALELAHRDHAVKVAHHERVERAHLVEDGLLRISVCHRRALRAALRRYRLCHDCPLLSPCVGRCTPLRGEGRCRPRVFTEPSQWGRRAACLAWAMLSATGGPGRGRKARR